MIKPDSYLCENKGQISCAVTAQLISNFVFAVGIVLFLFLNQKFQASSFLPRLYRPVCVGLGRKPPRPFFLRHGSNVGHRISDTSMSSVKKCN